jgi:hypothetical protein
MQKEERKMNRLVGVEEEGKKARKTKSDEQEIDATLT